MFRGLMSLLFWCVLQCVDRIEGYWSYLKCLRIKFEDGVYYWNIYGTNDSESVTVQMLDNKTCKTCNENTWVFNFDNCDNKSCICSLEIGWTNKQEVGWPTFSIDTDLNLAPEPFYEARTNIAAKYRTHHLRNTAFSDLYVADRIGLDLHLTVT